MASPSPTAAYPLQFCKVFLPQHLSQRLVSPLLSSHPQLFLSPFLTRSTFQKIPPAFAKHIKPLAGPPPTTVSLKGPGGGVWYADLLTVSGDLFLDTGWNDFIRDHSLQKWDFLVFRYLGNAHFDVLVFDRSRCGKEAALSARPLRDRGRNAAEEPVSAQPPADGGNAGLPEDTGKLGDAGDETLAEDGSIAIEEALTDGGKEDVQLPVGRDNEEGGKVGEDSGDVDKGGEETVLVRPSVDRGNAGEEGFLARTSEDGDLLGVIVKRKRGRPKKKKIDYSVVTGAPKKKRGRPRKEPIEGPKMVEGPKRTRGRPRKYDVGLGGTVPPERKRGRLWKDTSDGCVNPEGTLPPKEVTPRKEDHLAKGSSFSTTPPLPNLVKKHDTCIEANATMLHSRVPSMHPAFADYEKMPPTGEVLVKEKRQYGVRSQRRPVTSEEVDKVILKAKAFKSEYPFCVVQMYDSYVYYGFALGIPLKFARKHLPLPGGNVILYDPTGTRWDVKYVTYRRHGCFNAGWLKFSVTNNLESGDVCVFELVKNCELRVHIFRVVEEITPLIRAFQGRRKRPSKVAYV